MTKRKTYTKAFKTEAVKLLEAGHKPAEQLAVEYATLTWVDWFNNKRLLEPHR